MLASLLFKLGHPVEPAYASDTIQHPSQFSMLGNLALVKNNMRLRVNAGGDKGRRYLSGLLHQILWILPHCNGVQIDDAVEALMGCLQSDKVPNGAEIIAQMQIPRRLHPRQNP